MSRPSKFIDNTGAVPLSKDSKAIVREVIVDAAGASGFKSAKDRGKHVLNVFKKFEFRAEAEGCPELRRQVAEHKVIDAEVEREEIGEMLKKLEAKMQRLEKQKRADQSQPEGARKRLKK